MRIMTVRQPWADAIVWGGKTVENRPRNIAGDYRGPVLIHAGKHRPTEAEWDAYISLPVAAAAEWRILDVAPDSQFGVILGIANLVDVHESRYSHINGRPVCFDDHTPTGRACSEWAFVGSQHLVFEHVRALDTPIPWKGALGMRGAPFEVAGDTLYQQSGECSCPAGAALGDTIGHAPGCGLIVAARLVDVTRDSTVTDA